MALLRIVLDLAIPKTVADTPVVKAKLIDLYSLIKQAKALSVKINEGKPNEEMTINATYHICYHDEAVNKPCEPSIDI